MPPGPLLWLNWKASCSLQTGFLQGNIDSMWWYFCSISPQVWIAGILSVLKKTHLLYLTLFCGNSFPSSSSGYAVWNSLLMDHFIPIWLELLYTLHASYLLRTVLIIHLSSKRRELFHCDSWPWPFGVQKGISRQCSPPFPLFCWGKDGQLICRKQWLDLQPVLSVIRYFHFLRQFFFI